MYFLIIRWNTEFFWIQFNINFDFKLFHVPKFYYLLTDIICSCDGFWYLIKLFVNESNISRSHHRAAIVCSFDRFLTSIFRKQPQRIFLRIWTLLGGIHWVGGNLPGWNLLGGIHRVEILQVEFFNWPGEEFWWIASSKLFRRCMH